jgi:anti-anti-sigma factor
MNGNAAGARVVTRTEGSGTRVLELTGEIDMSNASWVQTQIESAVPECAERFAFDLTRSGFMDSSGIAVLLRVAEAVDYVEIRHPSEIVQRIIFSTGLSDVLHVQP